MTLGDAMQVLGKAKQRSYARGSWPLIRAHQSKARAMSHAVMTITQYTAQIRLDMYSSRPSNGSLNLGAITANRREIVVCRTTVGAAGGARHWLLSDLRHHPAATRPLHAKRPDSADATPGNEEATGVGRGTAARDTRCQIPSPAFPDPVLS